MLARQGSPVGGVKVLARSAEPSSSTFPTAIVKFRIGEQGAMTLLCKYTQPPHRRLPAWHRAYGHRHGIAYEGRLYRDVLQPLRMTTPRLCGMHDGDAGGAWLAIEYLEGSVRIKSVPVDLARAASWIGRFYYLKRTARELVR
jgi:hypothetical protein